MHIVKRNGVFIFIDNINSLFINWNEENAKEFLQLFNRFYIDTNYADFYKSHLPLFEEATEKFINEIYKHIDIDWFGKYTNKSNLRCIYSLSSGNYASMVNDTIIYSLVHGGNPPIIHEYCHAFANPIADRWYNENPEFKKLCDNSVNLEKMPFYNDGLGIAREYVTKAYNILYDVQHDDDLIECLSRERHCFFEDSFKYIEDVYNMVLMFEN